jgi:hypothetical protein
MAASSGTRKFVDHFDRAQVFTTTPGMNGWTIEDTSSAGAPTYLCVTEDGGAAQLTLAANSEAEIVTLYQNDVLSLDLARLQSVWFVAKVAAIDSVTTLCFGVASTQADVADNVAVNAWFRMEGSASTSAIVVETDDGTTDNDDNATGMTLAAGYKKFQIDFTGGIGNVRFFADGQRVGNETFSLAAITAGQNVQPFVQLQKASGTGVPQITIAQIGWEYSWTYGS